MIKAVKYNNKDVKAVFWQGEQIFPKTPVWDGTFADPEVHRIMMENYDLDGDGRLNEAEIEAIVSLRREFMYNKKITTFDELQFLKNVRVLPLHCFNGCSSLQSIVLPDSITSIGVGCFNGCSSLQSIVLPDSITSIGNDCFYGCSRLQSIVLPDSITSIGDYCFRFSSLQSIVLPDSITSIGMSCFRECSSLQSIVLPDSITSIGDYCFYLSRNFEIYICLATSPTPINHTVFYKTSSSLAIYVPDASVSAYKSRWSDYSSKITPLSQLPDEHKYLLDGYEY